MSASPFSTGHTGRRSGFSSRATRRGASRRGSVGDGGSGVEDDEAARSGETIGVGRTAGVNAAAGATEQSKRRPRREAILRYLAGDWCLSSSQ